jgi:MtN3 and saliva related transmembrane protein
METITVVGLLAACCTTWAFLPQVLLTVRTRDTRGLSLPMYLIFTVGVLLWLIYGLLLHDLPLILANGVTAVLAGTVLALKLKNG